jgi:hypothetical protein
LLCGLPRLPPKDSLFLFLRQELLKNLMCKFSKKTTKRMTAN